MTPVWATGGGVEKRVDGHGKRLYGFNRLSSDRYPVLGRRHGQHADHHLVDLGAMSFGAMMDFGGFNARLITPIIGRVKSVGGMIATVMVTALGLNIVAGDQYIAIVLPARMFMVEFRKRGLHPETLATAVETPGRLPPR